MQLNLDSPIPRAGIPGTFGDIPTSKLNGKNDTQGAGATSDVASKEKTDGMSPVKNMDISQLGKKAGILEDNSLPKLDPPSTQTSFDIGTAAAKFVDIMSTSNAESGKGLFILYQLLRLLEETVNTQKVSMQAMRQNETQLAIANIKKEADSLESAAMTSLIFGCISAAVQGIAAGMSLAGGVKGLAQAKQNISVANQIDANQKMLSYNQPTNVANANGPKPDLKVEVKAPAGQEIEMQDLGQGGQPVHNENVGQDNVQASHSNAPKSNDSQIEAPKEGVHQADVPKEGAHQADAPKENAHQADAPKSDASKKSDAPSDAEVRDSRLREHNNLLKTKLDTVNNKVSAEQNVIQGMSQITGAIATGVKGVGDSMSQTQQADAKRISAETQQLEQESQKTHDLTNSLDNLIQAILKLMGSVRDTEHEVNSNIYRGI